MAMAGGPLQGDQQDAQWQPVPGLFLVCSAALVNEQTMRVALHEETNLEKVTEFLKK